MNTHISSRERAQELAIEHGDAQVVEDQLQKEGYDNLMPPDELEAIVIEAKMADAMIPHRRGRTLPRIIGIIAVMMGIGAIAVEMAEPKIARFTKLHRYSPGGYGVVALVLGIFLIVKPDAAKTEL